MTLSYKIHNTATGDVNGNSLGYHFSFPSLSEDDITVTVAGSPKNKPADYTIKNWTADAGQNPYIEFTSITARGTGTIRISRGTTSTSPTHDFQVGSAIKAADLNSCNKQNIYLAQENRDSINALALGDASSAIQIDSANIKNLTIQAIDLASDAVETDKIKDLNVNTDKLADNAVTNNKVDTNAAIQGTKISPNFGSQNIVTTGTLSSGDMTISDNSPRILFTELNADPDYKLISEGGKFIIREETNQEDRLVVNTDGHVDVTGNLDVGAGADVTGNLTVTGTSTFSSDINTNGNDVYTMNGAFISNDSEGAFSNRSGNNIDHIWHEDTNDDPNVGWNFCSDASYKSAANAKVRAGEFHGDGSHLTNLLIGVRQVKEGMSTGTSSRTSTSWGTKTSVSLTNTTSSSRVLVISTYRLWSATPYSSSRRAEARTTRGDSSTFAGDTYDLFTHAGGTGSLYSPYHTSILWDKSTSSGTRTYKIRYRTLSGTAYISHAQIMAIEFRPT